LLKRGYMVLLKMSWVFWLASSRAEISHRFYKTSAWGWHMS